MQDISKQDLGRQVVSKRTASCENVWTLLNAIRDANKDPDFVGTKEKIDTILVDLEDAFSDFECSWEQHAKEYHE